MIMKVVTFEVLKHFTDKLIDYIDKRIELEYKGHTNCPNCGAVIKDKVCSYCGTNFIDWYKR